MTRKERILPAFSLGPKIGNDHFWLIDGQPNFAVIPAGTLDRFTVDMPIRLPDGDTKYGAIHISKKHGHWLYKQQKHMCVATMVHRKLSQPGRIHTAETADKLTLMMRLAPEAFMVLKVMHDCLSVTTLYLKQKPTDGVELAKYLGGLWATTPYKATPL
jgi:hypothetical protein